MNSEIIMQSDILDIIFEKRNKLYGAYALRRFYNSRLIKSLGATLVVVTIFSAFTFNHEKGVGLVLVTDILIATLKEPKIPEVKKEMPKQPIKSTQLSKKKSIIPVIIDYRTTPDSLQDIMPHDIIGNTNISVPGVELPVTIGEATNGRGGGEFEKPAEVIVNVNQPVDHPEIEPAYPGGINALRKFLERNLVNPTEMSQGKVVAVNVKFVVGYDGKLQEFTVLKDGGSVFNNEVIRVLKKMPQWIPGKSNGQNVAVYFTIPVKFVPAD